MVILISLLISSNLIFYESFLLFVKGSSDTLAVTSKLPMLGKGLKEDATGSVRNSKRRDPYSLIINRCQVSVHCAVKFDCMYCTYTMPNLLHASRYGTI